MQKITVKKAQYLNEQTMLRMVRSANQKGEGYELSGLTTVKFFNAINRLIQKGKIKFEHHSVKSKTWEKQGYWLQ